MAVVSMANPAPWPVVLGEHEQSRGGDIRGHRFPRQDGSGTEGATPESIRHDEANKSGTQSSQAIE